MHVIDQKKGEREKPEEKKSCLLTSSNLDVGFSFVGWIKLLNNMHCDLQQGIHPQGDFLTSPSLMLSVDKGPIPHRRKGCNEGPM